MVVKINMKRILLLFGVIVTLFFCFFLDTNKAIILCQIICIIICYTEILKQCKLGSDISEMLVDSRFYFFTIVLLYSIIAPFYCILLETFNNGFSPLGNMYGANVYYPNEVLKTGWINILFFVGILIGSTFHFQSTSTNKHLSTNMVLSDNVCRRKGILWGIVSFVSTLYFLYPFFRGGFAILANGGTITQVDEIAVSIDFTLMSVLFGGEVMTISTAVSVFYFSKSNISNKQFNAIVIFVVLTELIVVFTTTRRARALTIILCCMIFLIQRYLDANKKVPKGKIIIFIFIGIIIYLAEEVLQNSLSGNNISILYLLSRFDGSGPYDALLLSTREATDPYMLSNIIYGLFRQIPYLGKYIVSFLGINPSKAPLYLWMASHYTSIYNAGGGLAYLPQLEAYISLGYVGCPLFGALYGYIFAKKRVGIGNIINIALAFMVSRGSIQVLLGLCFPYIIICYLFYDKFLFDILCVRKSNMKKTEGEK